VRLADYGFKVGELARPALESLEPPLALGFHAAGLPDIEAGCDFDNFLTPVIRRSAGGTGTPPCRPRAGRRDEPSCLTLSPAHTVASGGSTPAVGALAPGECTHSLTGYLARQAWHRYGKQPSPRRPRPRLPE